MGGGGRRLLLVVVLYRELNKSQRHLLLPHMSVVKLLHSTYAIPAAPRDIQWHSITPNNTNNARWLYRRYLFRRTILSNFVPCRSANRLLREFFPHPPPLLLAQWSVYRIESTEKTASPIYLELVEAMLCCHTSACQERPTPKTTFSSTRCAKLITTVLFHPHFQECVQCSDIFSRHIFRLLHEFASILFFCN